MKGIQLGKLIKDEEGFYIDVKPVKITDIKAGDELTFLDECIENQIAEFLDVLNDYAESVIIATEEPFYVEKEKTYYLTAKCILEDGEEVENVITFSEDKPVSVCPKDDADYILAPEKAAKKLEELYPKKVLAYLNQFVVGQDDAKKKLSIEIFKHYCRMVGANKCELPKDNILLTGPTGCGKTYMVETLAKLIDVPFAKASCTSLTESGYVGDDVETVLQDLLKAANGDLRKAQFGIVFLDEIDKIGRKGENPSITRDVGGEGVQSALLTMIGGTTMKVPLQGNRKHPHGENVSFDTSNVLFIGAGCFEGIEEIVKSKKGTARKTIGFNSAPTVELSKVEQENNLRKEITKEDLKKFGMIPEFLGRFNILANLLELDKEALINICKLNNGEINKYKNLFAMFGKELILSDELYEELAETALKDKTGARGVKSALSNLLTEYTYNIDDTNTEIEINVA